MVPSLSSTAASGGRLRADSETNMKRPFMVSPRHGHGYPTLGYRPVDYHNNDDTQTKADQRLSAPLLMGRTPLSPCCLRSNRLIALSPNLMAVCARYENVRRRASEG